jgi:predicted nucleotidyltransferase
MSLGEDRTAVAVVRGYRVSDDALRRFAISLRERFDVERVLLFGSRARRDAAQDSDYDFIVVGDRFAGVHPLNRSVGIHDIFYETAGIAPLDLICVTPDEFEEAKGCVSLIAAVLPESIDLLSEKASRSRQ